MSIRQFFQSGGEYPLRFTSYNVCDALLDKFLDVFRFDFGLFGAKDVQDVVFERDDEFLPFKTADTEREGECLEFPVFVE